MSGWRPWSRRTKWGVAVAACAIGLFPVMPVPGRAATFLTFSWAVLILVTASGRTWPPGMRIPWRLVVAALWASAIGNTLSLWRDPPVVVGIFVVAAPAVVSSLLLVAVCGVVVRRGRGDVGGLIDATLVALAAGGLLWTTIVEPHIRAQYRSALGQATLAVVLLALAGAIGALLRVVETDTQHIAVLPLLLTGLVCNLCGFVLIRAWSDEATQLIGLMLYLTAYLALGVASVDPTMALLADATTPVPDRLGWPRLLMLGTALAAVPAASAISAIVGNRIYVGFLIGAVLVTVPLVMLRIGLLARELHRAEGALRYLAAHDPLTGVLNRRAFTDRLATEIASSRDCVLVFCDLDSFKAVNDRLGHTAGDQLLVGVAERLRSQVRENDVVGRFGGDEFLIMLHDTDGSDTQHLCTRLIDAFHRPFVVDGVETMLGVSIGAAASQAASAHPRSVTDLIRQADAAMYASKQSPPRPAR